MKLLPVLHRIYLLIVLFTYTISTYGQYVSALSWSEEFNIDKGDKVLASFALNDSVGGLLIESISGISILVFDGEPKRSDLTMDACCSSYSHVIRGETLSIFSRVNGDFGSTQRFQQYLISIDSARLLSTVDFDMGMSVGSQAKPSFSYVSPNGNLAITCQQSAFKSAEKASIKLMVFKSEEQTEVKIPTGYASDDFEILGASINNAGVVFIAAKTGIKLNSPFRRKHLLMSYNLQEQKLTEFDLSSDKLFTQDILVKTNEIGMELGGLYTAEPLEETHSDGYFYLRIDSSGENIIERRIHPFSPEMISSNHSIEDNKTGIEHIFLDGLFEIEGEPVVSFERRFQDQICTTDPRTGIVSCTDMFYFKGVSVESPRDRRISYTIQRNQVDIDRLSAFSSHAWISTPQGLLMLYNDHFKNQNELSDRMMNNASRSTIRFVDISEGGFNTTGVLTEEKQSDFVFVPRIGIATHGNRAILVAKSGRDYKLGQLNLNDLFPPSKGN